ncbi:hypothetical protein ZHAS_00012507 [Anopheles sinensis]|uniref:Uncharacterized protein n=1 Tax=Anopheles sinensis TaxID=74873 RepID=A0A084W329_ANOSI|nr:hypothetical protein ZHAS_00012507 [Anopheles sinensis]
MPSSAAISSFLQFPPGGSRRDTRQSVGSRANTDLADDDLRLPEVISGCRTVEVPDATHSARVRRLEFI